MGQCTIRWSNGHCAWSILPVGEANGNFLVRQAIQRLLSVGWGHSGHTPVLPNGHRGRCPAGQRLSTRWPLRGSFGEPRPGAGGRAPLSDRQTDI